MRTLQPQNLYEQPANFVGPIAKRTRSRCQERVRTIQKTWNASVDSVEKWGQAPYILRGYRVGLSIKETFLSMFVLHNETLNVWTHLIGCLYFAGALVVHGAVPEDIAVAEHPTWPIAIFMITAALCMGISAFFHLLLNYNYKLNQITSKLDYAGISLLVMGSFFPLLQYGFCNLYRFRENSLVQGHAHSVMLFNVPIKGAFHRPVRTNRLPNVPDCTMLRPQL